MVIENIIRKDVEYTYSYEEEVKTMLMALEWIRDNIDNDSSTLICTDS